MRRFGGYGFWTHGARLKTSGCWLGGSPDAIMKGLPLDFKAAAAGPALTPAEFVSRIAASNARVLRWFPLG
jgi:hypothetical protein